MQKQRGFGRAAFAYESGSCRHGIADNKDSDPVILSGKRDCFVVIIRLRCYNYPDKSAFGMPIQ
jgi:hypothetical protein